MIYSRKGRIGHLASKLEVWDISKFGICIFYRTFESLLNIETPNRDISISPENVPCTGRIVAVLSTEGRHYVWIDRAHSYY